MSEILTLQEVADKLRLSKPVVSKLLREGQIPAVHCGRAWRIAGSLVDDFLLSRSRERKGGGGGESSEPAAFTRAA